MIDAEPSLRAANEISVSTLAAYLQSAGWELSSLGGRSARILLKVLPNADAPIHIVLPLEAGIEDERRRVAEALRTLEVVEERPIFAIVDAIQKNAREEPKAMSIKLGSPRSPYLSVGGSYPLSHIPSLDSETVAVLKSVGIRTTTRLLESARSPAGRQELANKTGLAATQLLAWANFADRMRIRGVSKEYAELLEAAGVVTTKDLRYCDAKRLAKAMAEANAKRRLVRLVPGEKVVRRWIEAAKALPLKIKY